MISRPLLYLFFFLPLRDELVFAQFKLCMITMYALRFTHYASLG